ncbi:hypothetical protein BABINDRAFT_81545 [Babjeviella inositovora NRRL Y-12698]|uniref:Transcription regulator Rua1 C-terminal domain-containing protein n=1 Tax=Babjeviella inositovora NRRL Y-12698 TaxID=984486 RepID=A0A1E3R1A0_9ASCO|nr:uncharacterized protein BABINDRAFT_81545 [Babjeviella inositovora NRRL Y-12698]ODQ83142.1 hypothetical protein BABINDRAFT_81545 [Babjeviella inositovora NRRL Y-12698]
MARISRSLRFSTAPVGLDVYVIGHWLASIGTHETKVYSPIPAKDSHSTGVTGVNTPPGSSDLAESGYRRRDNAVGFNDKSYEGHGKSGFSAVQQSKKVSFRTLTKEGTSSFVDLNQITDTLRRFRFILPENNLLRTCKSSPSLNRYHFIHGEDKENAHRRLIFGRSHTAGYPHNRVPSCARIETSTEPKPQESLESYRLSWESPRAHLISKDIYNHTCSKVLEQRKPQKTAILDDYVLPSSISLPPSLDSPITGRSSYYLLGDLLENRVLNPRIRPLDSRITLKKLKLDRQTFKYFRRATSRHRSFYDMPKNRTGGKVSKKRFGPSYHVFRQRYTAVEQREVLCPYCPGYNRWFKDNHSLFQRHLTLAHGITKVGKTIHLLPLPKAIFEIRPRGYINTYAQCPTCHDWIRLGFPECFSVSSKAENVQGSGKEPRMEGLFENFFVHQVKCIDSFLAGRQ